MLLIYPVMRIFQNENSASRASVDNAVKIDFKSFKHELVGWQLGLATSDVSRFCKKLRSLDMARLPAWKGEENHFEVGLNCRSTSFCFDVEIRDIFGYK